MKIPSRHKEAQYLGEATATLKKLTFLLKKKPFEYVKKLKPATLFTPEQLNSIEKYEVMRKKNNLISFDNIIRLYHGRKEEFEKRLSNPETAYEMLKKERLHVVGSLEEINDIRKSAIDLGITNSKYILALHRNYKKKKHA